MSEYRDKIYNNYVAVMQNSPEVFDFNAARQWSKAYKKYLKSWLSADKNADIIDVGCGCGRLLYFLRENGYSNLKGIDISLEQIKIAKHICNDVICGNAIEYLDNNPQCFDVIFAIDLIEHFKKDESFRFLYSCYNALRNGGRIIIQTPNAVSPFMGAMRYGDMTHELIYTPESLKKNLQLCGFEKIEYKPAGPVIYNIKSFIRTLLWKFIRINMSLWNLIEVGSAGSGIYTRVFLISATKK